MSEALQCSSRRGAEYDMYGSGHHVHATTNRGGGGGGTGIRVDHEDHGIKQQTMDDGVSGGFRIWQQSPTLQMGTTLKSDAALEEECTNFLHLFQVNKLKLLSRTIYLCKYILN